MTALRRQRRQVRLLTAGAVLLLLGMVILFLWHERRQELASASTLSVRRAERLAEDVTQTLRVARAAIGQTEALLQGLPAGGSVHDALARAAAERAPLLAALALPFRLHALDAAGQALGPGAAAARHVHSPGNAAGSRWVVDLSQGAPGARVVPLWRAAARNALGVAAFAVDLDHAALLARLESSRARRGGSAALFRAEPDGSVTLLVRAPHEEAELGQRVRGALAQALAVAPRGQFEARTTFDGLHRVVAYQRLGDEAAALVVVYAMATDSVLADWRGQAPLAAFFTLLLATAILWGGRRLSRSFETLAQGQRALARSEGHFRALADNLPDVVVRFDAQGRHLYANPAVEQATGLPPAAFVGKTNAELGMPANNVAVWVALLQRVFEHGRVERLEFAYPGPQGLRHWESVVALEPAVSGEAPTALVISRDITERVRAGEEMRASEARHRELFEANPHPMWVFDLQTLQFLAVNDAAIRQYGYSREQFLAMTIKDIRPHEDLGRLLDNLAQVTEGIDSAGVWRHRTQDGRLLDVEITSHVLVFMGRRAELVLAHDVTRRNAAEQALRHSELRFRLAASYGQVWEWDFGTGGLEPSTEFFVLLGHPPPAPEDYAAAFERIVQADDYQRMQEVLRRHLRHEGAYRLQFRAFDAQHAVRWFETQGQAVWDARGHATYMAGTTFEITERRQAEDALRQLAADLERRVHERTAALAHSEARYRTIFETVPVSIGEEDWSGVLALLRGLRASGVSDGPAYFAAHPEFVRQCLQAVHIVRLNQKALSLHDAQSQRTQLPDLQAFYPEPEDLPQFVGEIEALWQGQRLYTAKKSLPSLTGRPLSLMMTMSLPALDGADGTALVCLVDITEVDRLNAELSHSLARLQQVNQELETFTYSVSHDLKAPLRGIDGYSRLLLTDHQAQLDEEGRRFLGLVRQATQQMGVLIDDLLAYSRLERRELILASLPLLPLVQGVLAGYRQAGQQPTAELLVDMPADLQARADVQGLTIALRNVIDNALKFSRDSQPPRVRITGTRNSGVVRLAVHDNGLGFDMKYHERIFAIFQRLHRAEDHPGTGVGLALVRKAMERMGGRVWGDSQPGQGATFTLELPQA